MPGTLHPPRPTTVEEIEVETEAEGITLALAMCPPGAAIELHAAFCDVLDCTCMPRVITKPIAMVC